MITSSTPQHTWPHNITRRWATYAAELTEARRNDCAIDLSDTAAPASVLQVCQVVQLVLQHCPGALNWITICSMLQVSKGVQQALQQSAGQLVLAMPDVGSDTDAEQLARFTSCAAWLPQHAGLVKGLTLECDGPMAQTAQHTLRLALQACAYKAHAAAQTPGGLLPSLPWRLEHVELCGFVCPSVLDALSACSSLTRLQLKSEYSISCDTTFFAALGHLQHLRQLYLRDDRVTVAMRPECAAWMSQLLQLVDLDVRKAVHPAAVLSLPASLTRLVLIVSHTAGEQLPDPEQVLDTVDLRHLRDLQELCFSSCSAPGPLHLPPAVTALTFCSVRVLTVLPQGLANLKQLQVSPAGTCVLLLQQLTALQELRQLTVSCAPISRVDEMAAMAEVMAAIGTAQQLTQLVVRAASTVPPNTIEHTRPALSLGNLQLHKHLRQLTRLQHLSIQDIDIQPADAMQLTALTALTALQLYNCRSIDDLAAAALACQHSKLRVLSFDGCNLTSPVLWPALGTCTTLRRLKITARQGGQQLALTASTLPLLTRLTGLTALVGPVLVGVSPEAYRAFRAALPGLRVLPRLPSAAGS